MSADNEFDSQMLSSPDESDAEFQSTAQASTQASTAKSPVIQQPTTSSATTMPISASGASIANSNGKRPIQTISNGNDDLEELAAMANGKSRQEFQTQTHEPSGYSWSKPEDAPGYGWLNKKSLDEYHRAWDILVHKEATIGNKYGDIVATVRKEKVMQDSKKQK